jgi:hypothetical protein
MFDFDDIDRSKMKQYSLIAVICFFSSITIIIIFPVILYIILFLGMAIPSYFLYKNYKNDKDDEDDK